MLALVMFSPFSALHAQTNGTWTTSGPGNWSDGLNWSGGDIASGATAIANFSTLNITGNHAVTIDAPFTIGTLTAQDLTTASHDWTFDGTGPLTLDNGLNPPLVTIGNRNTTISAPLAGSGGLTKNGAGALILNGNNGGLSGSLILENVTGTNNAGVILGSNTAIGGITSIEINGAGTSSGQYLGIDGGVTLGSGVAITLNSQGGFNAPPGAIRSTGANTVVNTIEGPINVTLNNSRISNNSALRLDITGPITFGSNNVLFRNAVNEGIHLTNAGNTSTGKFINSEGTLWIEPAALPATSILEVGASASGTFQTSGTFTRALGAGAGEVRVGLGSSSGRTIGFSARGGDLTLNFGGAAAEVFFNDFALNASGTDTTINTNTLLLNSVYADSKTTLANPLNLNGTNRNIRVDANVAELSGGVTGGGNLTKTGSGTLEISGASTYAGATTLASGILRTTTGDNRLPVGTTLDFTGTSGALELTTTNQTLANLTVPNLLAASYTVSGNSLTLDGAVDRQFGHGGAVTSAHSVALDLSDLSSFTSTAPANLFRVGLKAGSTNPGGGGVPGPAALTLADQNNITANSLRIGDVGASNNGGTATLRLGRVNTLNVDSINSGASGRSNSNLLFDSGLTDPSVTLRNTDGTSAVSDWRVGNAVTFNATTWTDVVDLSAGTVDALVTALTVGTADIPGTQANRAGIENGSFTMGAGVVDTATLTVGRISGNAASTINSTMAGNGTFTLNHAGGLLKATTITLAENTTLAGGAGARSTSGTLNLLNGTIEATTIQRGAQTGNATATAAFNWTDGTLRNLAGGDLLVDSLPMTLATGSHVFDATGSNTITLNASSSLSGSGGITKTGTGTVSLEGSNTYSGPTAVLAGTLGFKNSMPVDTAITVDAAATLALEDVILTVNPALDIDGALALAGSVKVVVPPASVVPGSFANLLEYGSIAGAANLASDYRNASFTPGATSTSLDVLAGIPLTWTGAGGSTWDVDNTVSWADGFASPETFFWADSVTFDEAGALVQPTVTLSGELRPASVNIDSTTDYSFGGTGVLTGPFTLTKNGTSTLTLGGSHAFTGGVSVLGGTLKAGGNQALGADGQAVTVASGATLDTNGAMTANRDYAVTISGSGVGGGGAIINSGATHLSGFGSLTLAADATIGGTGQWDVRPITEGTAVVDLGGFTLTKTGTGKIGMADGTLSEPGVIELNEGAIAFARMDVSGAGDINVNNGGRLEMVNYTSGSFGKGIAIKDGGTLALAGSNFAPTSAVGLTGDATVEVETNRTLTLDSAVSGSGNLLKTSGGRLILTGTNSYVDTRILGGSLQIGAQTTSGTLGSGPVTNDGTLVLNRSDLAYTVANAISGTGALNVGQNTGGAFDAVATLTGANTFAGNITVLSGGLRIENVAALGTGPKTIILTNGTNGRPQFYLDGSGGNITVPAGIDFRTSSPVLALPAVGNLAGDNVIEGNFTLQSGGGNTAVSVIGGSLTLNGNIAANTSSRNLALGGNIGAPGTVNGVISDGTHPVGVIMAGPNTWTFTGDNSYTGATTINGGTLVIDGDQSLATGTVTVNTGATLGGTGTIGGTVNALAGSTVAPGTSIGTLATTGPATLAGSFEVELDGTSADRLDVGGVLQLDGATLDVAELAAPSQPVYIIATYGSLSGTFAGSSGIPAGYQIDYDYNNLSQIALVAGGDAYGGWETLNGIAGAGADVDSDNDGIDNGIEFVIGGDPSGPGSDSNGLLPVITVDGTYLNFVFRRSDESAGYAPFVEYGTALSGWTPAQDGIDGVIVITEDNPGDLPANTDRVTVRIPRTLAAPDARLFARLRVDIP